MGSQNTTQKSIIFPQFSNPQRVLQNRKSSFVEVNIKRFDIFIKQSKTNTSLFPADNNNEIIYSLLVDMKDNIIESDEAVKKKLNKIQFHCKNANKYDGLIIFICGYFPKIFIIDACCGENAPKSYKLAMRGNEALYGHNDNGFFIIWSTTKGHRVADLSLLSECMKNVVTSKYKNGYPFKQMLREIVQKFEIIKVVNGIVWKVKIQLITYHFSTKKICMNFLKLELFLCAVYIMSFNNKNYKKFFIHMCGQQFFYELQSWLIHFFLSTMNWIDIEHLSLQRLSSG
ncbi:hypothetical protein RFI_02938 [Reticulomyxa filosa]|uniref:Uncharacterized protein n=1 Tax=Reticulomyxa filosa TaxID=46433 RepID=X6P938_RETFI|nr:hypothetical protein RFI_02938 [Reticulomyxa filosa]|eukprot:ETO34157.1 hypothetical protein RFI_02938 [Reticulomyxa filosa]